MSCIEEVRDTTVRGGGGWLLTGYRILDWETT